MGWESYPTWDIELTNEITLHVNEFLCNINNELSILNEHQHFDNWMLSGNLSFECNNKTFTSKSRGNILRNIKVISFESCIKRSSYLEMIAL